MNKITELSGDYQQKHLVPIEGSDVRAEFTLEFKPLHNCWAFTLVWGDFSTYNETLVYAGNILRQYRGIIPFGLMVTTKSGMDPLTLDTFSGGETEVFVLSQSEVVELEAFLYG